MDFLLIIAAIWLVAASWTDLRTREVADWLSFSLIAIAVAYRASESIIAWNATPITTSLLGLASFFLLANLLYHFKIFAGGDAKLLIALGAVVPSWALLSNMLVVGSAYGILYSLALGMFNHKKVWIEIKNLDWKKGSYILGALAIGFILGFSTNNPIIYFISGGAIILFLLEIYIGAVDKVSLIKQVNPKDLTEGDWLLRSVKLQNGKFVKSQFSGLTKKEIALLIKNKKKVYVRYGIPFIPVYLIAFLVTIWTGNIFFLLI